MARQKGGRKPEQATVGVPVPASDPDLFRHTATNDLLQLLVDHPDEQFTIRELSRLTDNAAQSVKRAVDVLEANDVMVAETKGNRRLVSRRTTFTKQKRASAYDFPLDAVTRKGKGAPPGSGHAGQPSTAADTTSESKEQRRLDTVVEQETDVTEQSAMEPATETAAADDADGTAVNGDQGDDGEPAALTELRRALAALQEVEQALSQA